MEPTTPSREPEEDSQPRKPMITFTPPNSGSTRLSPDVWQLICAHATANGNSSPREAIEQLIRRTLGTAQLRTPEACACSATSPTASTDQSDSPDRSAAAALDALLSD
ncbi:MAG: hypothetical protein AAFQ40_13085 [Cyanobacteria bacterium J06623_5]